MSVKRNIPQVTALMSAVEKKAGVRLQTHSDFEKLVTIIEAVVHEHLSETTLERIWAYSNRACENVSVHTLNLLSKFVGVTDWKSFCELLAATSTRESEEFKNRDAISVDTLATGTKIRLGWLPNREITIEYLGGYSFTVLESENSSIRPGDRFSCFTIRKGRELYLDKFKRKSEAEELSYVIGQRNGLTLVEFID